MTAAPASSPQPDLPDIRVHIVQGEFQVSADPRVMFTTTLGSCVAACIRDPLAGVGGMNHFLLPEGGGATGAEALRYGAYAMELLVNALLQSGAARSRLEAKLFGGACLAEGLTDVGGKNVAFAEAFLAREGIALKGGSVRGSQARKLQFWPVSGRARQLEVGDPRKVFATERPTVVPAQQTGSVEFFK